jgi:putative tricarboxylic transport membrane protein
VFEAALDALVTILDPQRLPWMFLGITVGLVIGVLPGLGGTVGMSLLLPFVFGMDPFSGIALLIGMAAVVHTSDTFPSVLLGVPGSSGSQATIMDGYPLARQGQAARALGAAFFVSMIGGIIGGVALFATLGFIRPVVLALGAPELLMLAFFGLSLVGILSIGAPIPGLIASALGLLIGSIGVAPATFAYRFTFDTLYLTEGLPIAVVALGLFALPEMLDLLISNQRIAGSAKVAGRLRDGVRDAFRSKWLVVRSALIGVGVGVIPGLGGAVVDWITYGLAAQTTKKDNKFGSGDIRGVIAPESANNAKEGGALVPTLLFGIPGSGTTAMLLGGLLLMGIRPGPSMIGPDLNITLAIIWTLIVANVFAAGACFALSNQIAKISLIPPTILVPALLIVMVVAAYQSTRHWGDILAFLVIGVVGWMMKQFSWPRAPVLIGFVLAPAVERYLWISISRYQADWLLFPGVITIAIMTLLVVIGAIRFQRSATSIPEMES